MHFFTLRRAFVLGVAVVAAVALAPRLWAEDPATTKKVEAQINAEGLAVLIRARVPLALLDARGTSQQFISGSRPCPPNAPTYVINGLVPNKATLVITYGSSATDARSQQLADRLAKERYPNVIRFADGVAGWTKARYRLSHAAPVRPPPPVRPPAGSGSRGSGGR